MSFLLSLILSVAHAGFLRMTAEPHLEIHKESNKVILAGYIQITNEGDEVAQEVFPELDIDQFNWKGASQDLNPGQAAKWHLQEELKNLCQKKSADCLQELPDKGEFLIRAHKHYQDQNSYVFSVPDVFQVRSSSTAMSAPLALQMDLVTQMSGSEYAVDYTLKNLTEKSLKMVLRPLLPDEMQLMSPPIPVEIPAQGELVGSFQFRNVKGLPGSQYVGFLTAEWAQEGERKSAFGYTTFEVPKPKTAGKWNSDQTFMAWWLWSLALGLIAMWAFWIRPLKKFRS